MRAVLDGRPMAADERSDPADCGRGTVIHRRLRGASPGSPRRRLINRGNHIGWQKVRRCRKSDRPSKRGGAATEQDCHSSALFRRGDNRR